MKQLLQANTSNCSPIMKRQVFTVKLKTRSCLKENAQMSSKKVTKLTLLKRMIAQKQQLIDSKANASKVTNNTRTVERLKDLADEKRLPITLQQQLSQAQQKSLVAPSPPPRSSPELRSFLSQSSLQDKNPKSPGQPILLRLPPQTQAQLAAQVPPYPPSYPFHKAIENMLPVTVQRQQQQQPQCVHSHPSSAAAMHMHLPRLIQQSSMPQTYQNQLQEQHGNPHKWQQHWQEQQQLQQLQQQHRSQYQQQFSQQQYHQQQKQQQYQLLRQQQQQQQQQLQQVQHGENNQYHIARQSDPLPQASPAHSYYARVPSSENLSQHQQQQHQQQQPITNMNPNTATSSNPSSHSSLQANSPPYLSLTNSIPPITLSTRDVSDNLESLPLSHPSLPVFHKAHSWIGGTDQPFKSHPYGMHPFDGTQQQIHQQQLRLQQQQHLIHQQSGQNQQQYNCQIQQQIYSKQYQQQAQNPQKQLQHLHAPRINPASQFDSNFPEACRLENNCQPIAHISSDSIIPLTPNNSTSLAIPSQHQSQQLIQTEELLVKGRSESWSQMQASTPSTIASKCETSQKLSPLEPTHQLLFSLSSEQQRTELEIADFLLDSTIKNAEDDDNDEFSDAFAKKMKPNPTVVASRKRRNSEEQADELLCAIKEEDAKFQFNNIPNVFEDTTDMQGFQNSSDNYFTNINNKSKLSQQNEEPPQEQQLPFQDYNFHHGILSKHTLANSNFFSDNEELHSEDHYFAHFQPSS